MVDKRMAVVERPVHLVVEQHEQPVSAILIEAVKASLAPNHRRENSGGMPQWVQTPDALKEAEKLLSSKEYQALRACADRIFESKFEGAYEGTSNYLDSMYKKKIGELTPEMKTLAFEMYQALTTQRLVRETKSWQASMDHEENRTRARIRIPAGITREIERVMRTFFDKSLYESEGDPIASQRFFWTLLLTPDFDLQRQHDPSSLVPFLRVSPDLGVPSQIDVGHLIVDYLCASTSEETERQDRLTENRVWVEPLVNKIAGFFDETFAYPQMEQYGWKKRWKVDRSWWWGAIKSKNRMIEIETELSSLAAMNKRARAEGLALRDELDERLEAEREKRAELMAERMPEINKLLHAQENIQHEIDERKGHLHVARLHLERVNKLTDEIIEIRERTLPLEARKRELDAKIHELENRSFLRRVLSGNYQIEIGQAREEREQLEKDIGKDAKKIFAANGVLEKLQRLHREEYHEDIKVSVKRLEKEIEERTKKAEELSARLMFMQIEPE